VRSTEGSRGVLACGSGIGISIAANKMKGIICALCHDHYTATMCREVNNHA
jgi:ribose 5-phosphate isomerase B